MKVVIITDTHFGVKNASGVFEDYISKFLDNEFFPYCEENNITHILHLGDFFDNRKSIHVKTIRFVREKFLNRLKELGITMDIILGNHDVAYKNTNSLSASFEILRLYPDEVNIHVDPTIVDYDGLKIALIPWINTENHDKVMEFVKTAKAPILGGHLELKGFEMMKGSHITQTGMSPDNFDRFEYVMSGHYHTSSKRGNVMYLGTPYELTWADVNDPKSFYVLDTSTRKLERRVNPYKLHIKLIYNDTNSTDDIKAELNKLDLSSVSPDCYVKIIVVKKTNPYLFDQYLDRIIAKGPFDIKIIETFSEYLSESVDDREIKHDDTLTILNSYVDAVETPLDTSILKTKLQALYVEAQQTETI
jgi:DNA repair exonuclease SbcCD nuclease subunit